VRRGLVGEREADRHDRKPERPAMNLPENTPAPQPEERKRKRRAVLAFGLAALAVGGIGAAATSAAWTDNVFFSAKADAATFDLEGSVDGTTWKQSATSGSIELTVDAAKLADLLPGQTRTVDLWVRNEGSVNAALVTDVSWTGSSFTETPNAVVGGLVATLTPKSTAGAVDQFTLTVTTPSGWADTNKGKTGTVVIKITGTATAVAP
jgi:hypothetical protein